MNSTIEVNKECNKITIRVDIIERLDDLCDWITLRCAQISPGMGNTVIAGEIKAKLERIIRSEMTPIGMKVPADIVTVHEDNGIGRIRK